MNPWAHHDRFSAINDAAMRQVGAEDLIVEIAAALSVAGEYVARLDLRPTQRIVDFNWAARQAARRLGITVDVTSQLMKADDQLQVWVRPGRPPS
ncbi:hypothetical protein [Paenarthrobacter aurescens]|jgi:hypothetical protein|uniref:Uncharacterized protein n=1 Tax=Paenarthrobacter aurescens (strain TC1) TaxID=290340 RepID=A1RCG2_PAEAT|nr:hypothetical protein [Paenarthrobacter aurescens]ABM10562.1 hypothetical protein AAur_pTC10050 [Paenarthrobacter aurescens TC1]